MDALTQENMELRERVRILEHQCSLLQAQLDELRASPNPSQKRRWHGYKSPTRIGAFDMLEVSNWEGSKLRSDGPWNYSIYIRNTNRAVILTQEQFDAFASVFDNYLETT